MDGGIGGKYCSKTAGLIQGGTEGEEEEGIVRAVTWRGLRGWWWWGRGRGGRRRRRRRWRRSTEGRKTRSADRQGKQRNVGCAV